MCYNTFREKETEGTKSVNTYDAMIFFYLDTFINNKINHWVSRYKLTN